MNGKISKRKKINYRLPITRCPLVIGISRTRPKTNATLFLILFETTRAQIRMCFRVDFVAFLNKFLFAFFATLTRRTFGPIFHQFISASMCGITFHFKCSSSQHFFVAILQGQLDGCVVNQTTYGASCAHTMSTRRRTIWPFWIVEHSRLLWYDVRIFVHRDALLLLLLFTVDLLVCAVLDFARFVCGIAKALVKYDPVRVATHHKPFAQAFALTRACWPTAKVPAWTLVRIARLVIDGQIALTTQVRLATVFVLTFEMTNAPSVTTFHWAIAIGHNSPFVTFLFAQLSLFGLHFGITARIA